MTKASNRYRTNLRELKFVLFEQLGLQDILGEEPFANWGREEIEMAIGEHTLAALAEEFLSGANVAFAMYPGLAEGAASVI